MINGRHRKQENKYKIKTNKPLKGEKIILTSQQATSYSRSGKKLARWRSDVLATL